MSGGGYGQSPMQGQQYGFRPTQYGGGGYQGGQGVGSPQGGDPRAAYRASQPQQPDPNTQWTTGRVYGGGNEVPYMPPARGGLQYDPNTPQMSGEFQGGNQGGQRGSPMAQPAQQWGTKGFTGMEFQSPAPTPLPPGSQPSPDYGSRFGAPLDALRKQPPFPQMPGIDPGRNMTNEAPGMMVNQRAAQQNPLNPMQPPPRQSLEDFTSTLSNPGAYNSGQIADLYAQQQKSFDNGTYGTPPDPRGKAPAAWGPQNYDFNRKDMAGKFVTPDLAWSYGFDAIGRQIGNDGNAMSLGRPAAGVMDNQLPGVDGGRQRPWMNSPQYQTPSWWGSWKPGQPWTGPSGGG